MSISFDSIPINLLTPGQFVEINASRATSGLPAMPQKTLVVGQKLAAGLAAANVPIRVTSADQAIQQFGRGSMLAAMCAGFLAANPTGEMLAFPVEDNAAGVASTKTVTLAGPATAAGTLHLYVAGQRVQVAVASAAAAATVATALAAAVNAAPDLPVTASAAGAVVTLTARHKGELGSDVDVRLNYREGETTPAGLTATIAAGVAGSGNPDLSTLFAAIGDAWFTSFVLPYTDTANLAVFEAELLSRWGPLRMIEGVAYGFKSGTQGTLAALGSSRNSPFSSIGGLKGSPTPPWTIAAVYAGVVTFHGAIDPARPFQTLLMPGVLAPAQADVFTRAERNLLLADGISTFTIDTGGNVLVERPVTTYQTNPFGLPDTAYLDVNTVLTLAYLRFSVRARISTKYPRHKLASDGTLTGPGQAVVTPKVLKAELVSLFGDWMEAGLTEDIEQFKADLVVERDETDPNRANALIPPNLVNQFRVFAAQIQYRL